MYIEKCSKLYMYTEVENSLALQICILLGTICGSFVISHNSYLNKKLCEKLRGLFLFVGSMYRKVCMYSMSLPIK